MWARRATSASILVGIGLLTACGSGATHVTAGTDGEAEPSSSSTSTTTSSTSSTSSSTTSTSTTTTTAAASGVDAAAPIVRHVTGTHAGTEHFTMSSGRCAVLDHHLDEVFTLADGAEWNFASAYCGTVDADGVWSGTGMFTFTASDGTLSGRSTSRAKLPSEGVPYRLDIDEGTGAYAGATGTCTVDEHLSMSTFGVQDHHGAFTCDLTIDPPG